MAISEKISALVTEKQQMSKAIEARAILQDVRANVQEAATRLQEIADSGSFNTIDVEIKNALIIGWELVIAAQADFEDADLATLLDWRE